MGIILVKEKGIIPVKEKVHKISYHTAIKNPDWIALYR